MAAASPSSLRRPPSLGYSSLPSGPCRSRPSLCRLYCQTTSRSIMQWQQTGATSTNRRKPDLHERDGLLGLLELELLTRQLRHEVLLLSHLHEGLLGCHAGLCLGKTVRRQPSRCVFTSSGPHRSVGTRVERQGALLRLAKEQQSGQLDNGLSDASSPVCQAGSPLQSRLGSFAPSQLSRPWVWPSCVGRDGRLGLALGGLLCKLLV